MKNKSLLTAVLVLATLSAVNAFAAEEITSTSSAQSNLTVEQRLAILERKYENDQEAAAAKARDGFSVTAGKDSGFAIKSNDGNFVLKFSGVLQADYRDYLGDHGNAQFADQFLLRRVRPTFEGTVYKYIAFRITPDFANGGGATPGPASTLLPDAYFELQYFDAARLRAGKFKSPVGLEQLQTDVNILFVERSLATQLVPNRDTGVQLSGDFKGVLSYQAAVLNGVIDGGYAETDSNDGKDYVGRLFLQPFKLASSEWINGFGFGAAGSIGDQFGSAAASNLTPGYKTDGQQTFFSYQANVFANGQRKRVSPQAYWYTPHAGLLWEYVASSQEIQLAKTKATIDNRAWQLAGSYVLTGERPSFNGIKPRRLFDPKNGTWGALELAGRYSVFKVDNDAYSKGFATLATAAKAARAWATGLNWYLNNSVRITTDYAVTSFDGGAAGNQDRATEKVVLNRFQLAF